MTSGMDQAAREVEFAQVNTLRLPRQNARRCKVVGGLGRRSVTDPIGAWLERVMHFALVRSVTPKAQLLS